MTFPLASNQGVQPCTGSADCVYAEKLLVGWRAFEAAGAEVAFPFGTGLSYTSFEYEVSSAAVVQAGELSFTASIKIRNTGSRVAREVVQLYLGFPASAGEPVKQLKGFKKVELKPGAVATVSFALGRQDLSIWDVTSGSWKPVAGAFTASFGSSSRDLKASVGFTA